MRTVLRAAAKMSLGAAGAILLLSQVASAQTPAFTYQGRLTDGPTPPTGTYQMEFKLFDALSGGAQQGSTITNNAVAVDAGLFTVQLDFSPATPFAAGANRWLEIGVRKASDPPGFTTLLPRQPITSSPYSIKTVSATSADGLSAVCVGCVTNANINTVAGSKVTGAVASATSATSATTAGNVTGTVAIANGGTGATTAANARTGLGLGSLATVSPTGTANATTFLRGDNSWAAPGAGASPLRVFDSGNNLIGFVIGFTVRTVTVMTSTDYVFTMFTSGQLVSGQIYWSSAACSGTPFLNDGSSTGGRVRFSKALAFASDSNSLYSMSNPDAASESTSILASVGSFRNTASTTPSGISPTCDPAGPTTGGFALTAITPAAAGIVAVPTGNPLKFSAPLIFQ